MKEFDKETIKYFFLKDENAVKKVYMGTYRLLFHIAFSFVNVKEDAEDIVSETYKRAFQGKIEDIKKPKFFIPYLCSICRNYALDFLKRRSNEVFITKDVEAVSYDAYKSDLLDKVRQILTKEQYDVFIYRGYFELPFKEISSLINKEESACRRIYYDARQILKSHKELWR